MKTEKKPEIEISPYNLSWPKLFEEEAKKLRLLFGEDLLLLKHYGSTSIFNMFSKPIIDILLGVSDIKLVDQMNNFLLKIDYLAKGEFGVKSRRFFVKSNKQYHLSIFAIDNPELHRQIRFNNYLRAYSKEAERYCELKKRLALQYKYDAKGYSEGKKEFISELHQKAEIWEKLEISKKNIFESKSGKNHILDDTIFFTTSNSINPKSFEEAQQNN